MITYSCRHIRLSRALSTIFVAAAAALTFCVLPGGAYGQELTLDMSSALGSYISFSGTSQSVSGSASFTFTPGTVTTPNPNGYQWQITGEQGGSAALGLYGSITNGPFYYGPVTVSGNEQTATVSGPLGNLEINDGSNVFLSGSINFIDITTFGAVGGLNSELDVNVTDLTYSGTNVDLLALVAHQSTAAMDVSFQFAPKETLTQLSNATNAIDTSYSASLSIDDSGVPEPSTWAMLATGAAGLLFFSRRRAKALSSQS